MQANTHYTVLARRFRPQQFQDVVGQQHIATALQNAIRGNRVAHAYLFTGARGVGKTSTARIFAKALNCPQVKDAVPCDECDVCRSIAAGNDIDVLEIDGASNRGIDNIRDIRANVGIKSMRSPHKIYIIDEVHMLSKDAFNALLKTLEEPPPNVKFVFCTTEPEKLPDTILSRCQRFDFCTIGAQSISDRLKQIAEAEGYQVDDEALQLVARRAAGSMRDSQSLFDQLLSFGETHLTPQDVHKLLGTADDDRLISMFDRIIARDAAAVFAQLDAAIEAGVQLGEFCEQCLSYCRDLMIVATGAEAVSLRSVFESNRAALRAQADSWGLETIVAALQILADTNNRMFRSVNARPLAELGLMRLTQLGELARLSSALRLLQSGQLSLPAGGRNPGTPPASPREVSNPDEKKNRRADEIADGRNADSPLRAETAPPIEFVSENADRILSRLLAEVDTRLQPHLKSCSRIAISGPFRLELHFPMSYDFSREYCEKSTNLKDIEETASKIAGNRVQVGILRVSEDSREASGTEVAEEPRPKPPAPTRPGDPSEIQDGYVQQAIAVLQATVVKVQPLREASHE